MTSAPPRGTARPKTCVSHMSQVTKTALLFVLVSCSNIGLISQRLAISGDGGNLFSVRDLAVIGFIIVSFRSVLTFNWRRFASAPVLATLAMCLYTIPLAVRGLNSGNNIRDIEYEAICALGWLTGLCLLATLRSDEDVRFIVTATNWLGFLMSIGVICEVVFRLPLVTGAVSDITPVPDTIMRSTPSCWPMMIFSTSCILARTAGDATLTRGKKSVCIAVATLELTACILTLSRGLVLGFLVAALCLAFGIGRKALSTAIIASAGLTAAWFGGAAIGDNLMSHRFSSVLQDRYAVFTDSAAGAKYSATEERPEQWRAMFTALDDQWAITGTGLGTPLWKVDTAFSSSMPFSDVSVIQLGVRFGLLGWVFLGTFLGQSVICIARARNCHGDTRWLIVGVAAGLCGVWAAGLFGNVWSLSYTAAPVTLLFFVPVAMRKFVRPAKPKSNRPSRQCSGAPLPQPAQQQFRLRTV